MDNETNIKIDFETLAFEAIKMFHLQNIPSFVKQIDERPTLAIELFNKLKMALSDKDKELAMFYLKGSTEYQQKKNEVDSIFQECDQTLSELKDTPPNEVEKIQYEFHQKHKKAHYEMNEINRKDRLKKEKIEKVVNEIKSIVIPIRNELIKLMNENFWSKIKNDKLIISKEYFSKIEQLNANLNKISIAKYKTYCIATYSKLNQFNNKRPHMMFEGGQPIVYPITRLKWHGTYQTPTEKKIAAITRKIFKVKHLKKIADYLENNEIKSANTFYNEHQKKIKQKENPKNSYIITYPYHKYKMDAVITYQKGTITLPFKAFFGADVRDDSYINESLDYSMIVNDIRSHTGQSQNNETLPPNPKPPINKKRTATEQDLFIELESIESVVIWLQVTGKLETVIKEFITGKPIRDKLVNDGHFENLITKKLIDSEPAKNGGRLSKAINCLVSKKLNKDNKLSHDKYPFSYAKVQKFNVLASSEKYKHLGLDKKAKELIKNYDEPLNT